MVVVVRGFCDGNDGGVVVVVIVIIEYILIKY